MKQEKSITEIFIALFKEVYENKVMWYLSTGQKYTAGDMVKEFENNSELGKQYISDVLRVSRDLISRHASKG